MEKKIVPVLLGADLNCYNVARAFHEQYGVTSYAFGRYAVSATKYSRIIQFTAIPHMDQDDVMLETLREFAREHADSKKILFGCTDDYVAMIIRNRAALSDYVIPYPGEEMLTTVARKASFYEVCEQYGIPYPKTVILSAVTGADALKEEKLGFSYPVIVKPSSSADYWKHEFPGMKKVYTATSPELAASIVAEIYGAGYPDQIIIQEMIDGGDSQMRVFTAFSDHNGKVRAMCLGHTMLEEHTPKGLGNHAAIVTEPTSSFPVAEKIREMLESMGYTGFSNFDIKLREGTDDDFRVFEINLRQGRSNYYLTSAGLNVARLAAEVFESDGDDCVLCDEETFWHHVPRYVAYTYTEDKALIARAKSLHKQKKETCSLMYRPDFRMNPLRLLCVAETLRRQIGKFRKYYPTKK